MKIRIKGNSIRVRLSPLEVTLFAKERTLVDHTNFGNGVRLTYQLNETLNDIKLSVSYENHCINIYMPSALIDLWSTTDQIGFENNTVLDDGSHLFILVEKDQ